MKSVISSQLSVLRPPRPPVISDRWGEPTTDHRSLTTGPAGA
jgi:hypothetical protein